MFDSLHAEGVLSADRDMRFTSSLAAASRRLLRIRLPANGSARRSGRRNSNGQTVGFDKAVPTKETVAVQTISGAELGIVLRGPDDAAACVIATDPSEGLRYSAQHPDQLVIFAAKHLSRRVMTQLRDITQGRKISIIQTYSADPAQDLITKHLKGAKLILWENTYNSAPEIAPEARPAPEAPDDLDDMPGFST